jgi:long-chain acyl-CoA synthetase
VSGEGDHVGELLPSVEMKLSDLPELGYTSQDIIEGGLVRRGEICLRGPMLTTAYFENLGCRRSLCDSDGWFRTGDIGQIMQHG